VDTVFTLETETRKPYSNGAQYSLSENSDTMLFLSSMPPQKKDYLRMRDVEEIGRARG
jgi:hypothetical protein